MLSSRISIHLASIANIMRSGEMLVTVHSLIYTCQVNLDHLIICLLTNLQVVIIQGKVHYLNVFLVTIGSQSYLLDLLETIQYETVARQVLLN